MNCFGGRSLVFGVRWAAHQSGGFLRGSGKDYWAFRRLHMVSHSPSDQRGTRLSPHLTPRACDFTGISTQSCLISPSTLFLLMAISDTNACKLACTRTHTGTRSHLLTKKHAKLPRQINQAEQIIHLTLNSFLESVTFNRNCATFMRILLLTVSLSKR